MSKKKKNVDERNPYDLIQGLTLVSRKNKHINLTLYATTCESQENFEVHMKDYDTKIKDCEYGDKDIEDISTLVHVDNYCRKINNRYDAVDAFMRAYMRNPKAFKLYVSAFEDDDTDFIVSKFI